MKNKDFFYLQYNKIDWKNQEETKINSFINNHIIQNVILKHPKDEIAIFDIGFGIGFFFKMLVPQLEGKYKTIALEGCEPSKVNFEYFKEHISKELGADIQATQETFQSVQIDEKFDFITAIYVFPHFLSEDLENIVKKIHSMLKDEGKFILVLADEKYLEKKLRKEKDLFIEKHMTLYNDHEYKEVLHYSDIPKIGKVIDYNREESYYVDLFTNNGFDVDNKETLEDKGFVCTLFIFKKLPPDGLIKLRRATIVASAGASTRLAGSKLSDEEVEQISKSSGQK